MTLGEHISVLRKKKKLAQNELGKRAGTSGDLIGRYERDEVKPSIEVVIKIADALEVSIDFLVGKTDVEIDQSTLNRLAEIAKLPDEGKQQILMVVDALLRDFKAKQAYS